MNKTYYEILGIQQDADIHTIKKAYRHLALEVHPDKVNNNSEAFRNITEAYKTLSNPEEKAKYDKTLKPTKYPRIYKYHFGTDLRINLKVKMSEIISEKTKNIITTRKGLCNFCNGTGSKEKILIICPNCSGRGIDAYERLRGYRRPCKKCHGLGKIPKTPLCDACSGKGLYAETIRRKIKLSSKHLFSRCIIIPGAGNCCPDGPPGDLLIDLDIDFDKEIKLNGINFERNLEISPAQAILGDKITVDIYGRKEKIIIPPGTQFGYLLEKEGAGLNFKQKGNLLLRIHIKMPEELTEKEKELYKKLLEMEKKNDG